MTPEESIRAGRVNEALRTTQEQVRKNPADAKCRVLLFQLLALIGDWERAGAQLRVAAELDAGNLFLEQVCRQALLAEVLREEIFSGRKLPLILGEPQEWLGWLVQANQLTAQGHHVEGQALRQRAFDAAPVQAGAINGARFEWIADADQRLGPVLEVLIDGKYYWVPFNHVREMTTEPPTDLRDVVWLGAQFTWLNGGRASGLIPARYPGSAAGGDDALRLGRQTRWSQLGPISVGLGQRMWATDQGEYPLLEVRRVVLDPAP